MNTTAYARMLKLNDFYTHMGKIEKIVGSTIEATGLSCNMGDVCRVSANDGGAEVLAEVVGFRQDTVLLMPYHDTDGIGYGSHVLNTGAKLMISVGESMIGRTINALGQPIDGGPPLEGGTMCSINAEPANPMERPPIDTPMEMGIKAIDGFLTIGKGQRMGIFAGSGVGKSTLMGMLARNVRADINVIALVGERGREVMEFIDRDLGPEGVRRSVLVVETSDQSAMMRMKCTLTATTIAEYFCSQGKDVLLMMDSLTRFCMAQREIGLSIGEPPVARGYTPSIYTSLPKLLERPGNFTKGSITGIYTVLVEGDDTNEPVADTVRSIIDGHIMLSRKIATRNHYPAIDVLGSISRIMNGIVGSEQKEMSSRLRNLMAVHEANQDLLAIGAYKAGSNPLLDDAIHRIDAINDFLQQKVDEKFTYDEMLALMRELLK